MFTFTGSENRTDKRPHKMGNTAIHTAKTNVYVHVGLKVSTHIECSYFFCYYTSLISTTFFFFCKLLLYSPELRDVMLVVGDQKHAWVAVCAQSHQLPRQLPHWVGVAVGGRSLESHQ